MTTLADRLRSAIDAEAHDVELSITNEIESLRADGGIVMTREEILTLDAEEEGGGPYTRRLRRCAADRKILAEHPARERRESWDEYRTICATCTYDGGTDVYHYPCPTLRALAEAYGVEA